MHTGILFATCRYAISTHIMSLKMQMQTWHNGIPFATCIQAYYLLHADMQSLHISCLSRCRCKHGIMAYHLPHAYRHTICYMQTCNLYTYVAHTSTHTPTCEANHLTVREPCHELDGGIFLHIAQRANMLWARFQLLCSAVCVCGREHARRTRKRPPREREYA